MIAYIFCLSKLQSFAEICNLTYVDKVYRDSRSSGRFKYHI